MSASQKVRKEMKMLLAIHEVENKLPVYEVRVILGFSWFAQINCLTNNFLHGEFQLFMFNSSKVLFI